MNLSKAHAMKETSHTATVRADFHQATYDRDMAQLKRCQEIVALPNFEVASNWYKNLMTNRIKRIKDTYNIN